MNPNLYRELVEFLQPHTHNDVLQNAVKSALIGTPALYQLVTQTSAQDFVTNLLITLDTFGDIQEGQPALVAVLEELSDKVGVNKQRQIEGFIAQLRAEGKQKPPPKEETYPPIQYRQKPVRTIPLTPVFVLILLGGIILGIAAPRLGTLLEATTPTPSLTPTITPTPTPRPPTATRTPRPTSTPTPSPTPIPLGRLLFEEDFEDGSAQNIKTRGTTWQIMALEDGNTVFEAYSPTDWISSTIGTASWSNYLLEYRFNTIDTGNYGEGGALFRLPTDEKGGFVVKNDYRADGILLYYVGETWSWNQISSNSITLTANRWYTARIFANKNEILVYIDDRLILAQTDSRFQRGFIQLFGGPTTRIQFDDIRVWALEP